MLSNGKFGRTDGKGLCINNYRLLYRGTPRSIAIQLCRKCPILLSRSVQVMQYVGKYEALQLLNIADDVHDL